MAAHKTRQLAERIVAPPGPVPGTEAYRTAQLALVQSTRQRAREAIAGGLPVCADELCALAAISVRSLRRYISDKPELWGPDLRWSARCHRWSADRVRAILGSRSAG